MKTRNIFGFTLLEMLISITILILISAMTLASIIQLGETAAKTRKLVKTRKQFSTFTQGMYNFVNKSVGVYFWDGANEVQYLTSYPDTIGPGNPILDTLYLVKDGAGNLGTIVYDPTAHTITYFKTPGDTSTAVVMLRDVYRKDYIHDQHEVEGDPRKSDDPVFRFPHLPSLYDNPSNRPSFVLIECRKLVIPVPATSTGAYPLTIPINLMCRVDALS